MSGQLSITDIEVGLEKRWETQGHNVVYVVPVASGGVLGCTRCHKRATLLFPTHGGWTLTNNDMDEPCQ